VLAASLFLSGCQTFGATDTGASKSFVSATSLSDLADFGDGGGALVVGVVSRTGLLKTVDLANVPLPQTEEKPVLALTLGDFLKRGSFDNSRINPAIELGAFYFAPMEFNNYGNVEFPADPNEAVNVPLVIQKLCGSVDGHGLDQLRIYDEPSGINDKFRKIVLSGDGDAPLLHIIANIKAKADSKYLVEIEIKNSRKRYISSEDASQVSSIILSGPTCAKEYWPQTTGRKKFQLTKVYYGEMRIRQVFEISGGVTSPLLNTQLQLGSEAQDTTFLFFKAYGAPGFFDDRPE
jgi:hypothetical protein